MSISNRISSGLAAVAVSFLLCGGAAMAQGMGSPHRPGWIIPRAPNQ